MRLSVTWTKSVLWPLDRRWDENSRASLVSLLRGKIAFLGNVTTVLCSGLKHDYYIDRGTQLITVDSSLNLSMRENLSVPKKGLWAFVNSGRKS